MQKLLVNPHLKNKTVCARIHKTLRAEGTVWLLLLTVLKNRFQLSAGTRVSLNFLVYWTRTGWSRDDMRGWRPHLVRERK